MSTNDTTPILYIGTDAAKETLQLDPVHLQGLSQVTNTPKGLQHSLKN